QGDIAEPTGNIPGIIPKCKVGDAVIELSPDSAAAGQKIVIEAKQKDGYTFRQALSEIDEARRNRGAQIGLFVFSRRTAPAGQEVVSRIGDDVFIVWDHEDEASDLFLKVGYTLAKALCVK